MKAIITVCDDNGYNPKDTLIDMGKDMKLEKQVCSLELAKRLKELGVKQESYFYWSYDLLDSHTIRHQAKGWGADYSAFTVAELGEMLPEQVPYKDDGADDISFLLSGKQDGLWWVNYTKGFTEKTEVDARARMLIHLIENNLLTDEWRKQWMFTNTID